MQDMRSRAAAYLPGGTGQRKIWLGVLAIGVIGLVAGFGLLGQAKDDKDKKAPTIIPVQVAKAEKRDALHESEVVGSFESLQHVTVRAQVEGILTRIYFREGQLVKQGELLATIDDRALKAAVEAAEAQLARDEASYKLAEVNLKRYQSLLERDAISRQTVDQQQAEADQLKATIRLDQANLNSARVNLSFTRITSPVSGRVGIRQVDEGNVVRVTDANGIVTVAQMHPISAVFPVSQQLLDDLKQAQENKEGSMVEALDSNGKNVLASGKIIAFDNNINPATGTMQVRAEFDNKTGKLTPGAFASLRIRTGLSGNATVVPAIAVRPGITGHFLYRVVDGKAERVNVETGYTNEDFTVITKGVEPGDVIVTDGYSRLTPGAEVSIRQSAETARPDAGAE